ncbi:DUF5688 family protein [[Clostridium] fimetarium]|uniref:Uncharacterized protein n=1 Tax=[Clostridium] fimetarium TaxID=99656 RepID=A0A1I0QWG0_9FIRM|nr:DUF5688 family protein [[Clostridium] fimetarium]SEW31844.1 hypothetical protein SAMN05421659_109190 [[Clostridium] fimetarium]
MTGYVEFKETIQKMIQQRFDCTYKVKIQEVIKNNGIVLYGLSILSDSAKVSPTIYLESHFQSFEDGLKMKTIVDNICQCYQKHSTPNILDVEHFLDFNKIKSKVVYKIINADMNQKLLEDVPHILYLDLAIIFYYLFEANEDGTACVTIHNAHMKMWAVTTNELLELAKINTPKLLRFTLSSMEDVLMELLESSDDKNDLDVEDILATVSDTNATGMYILSNISKINGSSSILYPEVLSKFAAKLDCDLYVLPSSCDEVILVKAGPNMNREELDIMVSEVNLTVEAEKILSNHTYYYDRAKDELSL